MELFVKICGLCRADDVEGVRALAPDAVGFVFWPPSPRAVRPADVAAWTGDWPRSILRVGVFVDLPRDEVRDVMRTARLDVAQLHGSETPEFCAGLGRRVWRAMRLEPDAAEIIRPYDVEAVLLDSGDERRPGGTGRAVDWGKARSFVIDADRRVILAGGLTPGNVAAAARAVRPWGVDVSTGVETAPGRKDLARVKDFIETCRSL
jgi:phosphoribosylanthranilate isomerase